MSTSKSIYQFTADEVGAISTLAHYVLNSKQNVGQKMTDAAGIVHRFIEGTRQRPIVQGAPLEPREVCLMCGTVGADKVKRVAKAKPACHICSKPFTRGAAWRLHRGRRVHCACIDQ